MSTRAANVALFSLPSAALVFACAQRAELSTEPGPEAGPSLVSPEASAMCDGDACVEASPAAALCIATTCPSPWETCPAKDGITHRCGTNLQTDQDNCGACGSACLTYEPIHMTSRCVKGGCELECLSNPRATPFGLAPTEYHDCNNLLDDGCEVDVLSDAANCGVCGAACGAGQHCFDGKCGCKPGLTDCGGTCIDLKNSDTNCGMCGNECVAPTNGCAPTNTYYGCVNSQCGVLKCGGYSADCNNDLSKKCASDGCEVDDISFDRNNCGGCGITCKVGEECRDEGNGPECLVPCLKTGTVLCGDGHCADILNDPDSCGGCSTPCPNAAPNQVRSCTKGVCAVECAVGYADCNGDPVDGCETDLRIHQANCGTCGHACDIAAGQPCVEGKCLETECDAGVTR